MGERHSPPACQRGIHMRLQTDQQIAVFQIFQNGRCGRVHPLRQPGGDGVPIQLRAAEVVGVADQIAADIGKDVLPHHIFVAEVLQNTVR